MRNKHLYDDNWSDVIRPQALKAANYRCQKCNAKHKSYGYRDALGNWVECDPLMIEWCKQNNIKVKRLFLQIAHIDHIRTNNIPSNLMALCPRCHFLNDKHISTISRKSK